MNTRSVRRSDNIAPGAALVVSGLFGSGNRNGVNVAPGVSLAAAPDGTLSFSVDPKIFDEVTSEE